MEIIRYIEISKYRDIDTGAHTRLAMIEEIEAIEAIEGIEEIEAIDAIEGMEEIGRGEGLYLAKHQPRDDAFPFFVGVVVDVADVVALAAR